MPNNFGIPNELNPPAARGFWARVDQHTQYFLTELHRNREIYGVTFDSDAYENPRLNAIMRYQGRDYAFSVGKNYQVMFTAEVAPPVFHNRQSFSEVLKLLAS